MTTIQRRHGVELELPDGLTANELHPASAPTGPALRGRRLSGGPAPAAADAGDDVAQAMTAQGMTLLDGFALAAVSSTGATRGAGRGKVAVELEEHEDAVLLLERDGMYVWRYPSPAETRRIPRRRQGPRVVPGSRRVVFELSLASTAALPLHRRGLIDELAGAGLRAWVLKFAARHALAAAVKVLERNVRHRLVHLTSAGLDGWTPVASPRQLPMPDGRAARILLLVHGTFSSTAGSFHALAATPWGQAFLGAVIRQYDLVLGFDHPTLGYDPAENATELLAALEGLPGTAGHSVDVIAFSRGCMVARSLAELLLPTADSTVRVRRMVLVGATNLGTRLAEPENWECLADLYTNLAVDACRLLQLFPAAAPAATVLKESLASLGALVKYLAVAALKDRVAPGLAALAPGGAFSARLNAEQSGRAMECFYYLVSSEFDAALAGREEGLPARLLSWLLDLAADKFMDCSNDLVVDVLSMTGLKPKQGVFVLGRIDFRPNPHIHHTAYFMRPELTRALTRWLDLAPQAVADAAYSPESWLDWAIQEEKILVLPAQTTLNTIREQAEIEAPEFVVLTRSQGGSVSCFIRSWAAIRRETGRLTPEECERPIVDLLADSVLALHPGNPSPVLSRVAPPSEVPREMFVLLEGDRVASVAWPPGRAPLARLRQLMPFETAPEHHVAARGGLRRRGGGGRPEQSESSSDQYYFGASMNDPIEVGRTETVTVIISRECLQAPPGAVSALADARLSHDDARQAKLIIQLIPKTNLEILGEDRFDIAPQSITGPLELAFDIRGSCEGEGELWVLVRHGPLRLATLTLKTSITGTRQAHTSRAGAAASSRMEETPDPGLPVLQIFERRNGTVDTYLFALDMGDGNYLTADSAPLRTDRQAYINAIYAEIEERWLGSRRDFESFNEELRAFGGTLFDQLIPVPIQRALWSVRDRLRAIHVLSEEPVIPWELVHLKPPPEDGQPQPLPSDTHFLAQKGLVRWLHNYRKAPRRIDVRRGHAFHSIPDYAHPDYQLPAAQAEIGFLEAELQSRSAGNDAASLRNLLQSPGKVDLFHFSGHGEAETDKAHVARMLLEGRFEGTRYMPDYLRSDVVAQQAHLCGENGNRPVVMLNACQVGRLGWHLTSIGGFAEAFLRAGAGIFVGTLWAVGDTPAQKFSEAFYRSLRSGRCLADAASAAREAAREAGEATWLAYAVYGHPQAVVHFEDGTA